MDCNDEPRRLYQKLVSGLKKQIESGDYPVGHKLPAERFLAEEYNVSRTVVREAIIILEAQGYVEVRKGSGIHVVNTQQQLPTSQDNNPLLPQVGPFELLQARQLIESNIAEFAATQATKQDIANLMYIQEQSRQEKEALNSIWDLKFHVQVALATQNSVMTNLVKNLWEQRINNPYWIKLHEHVGDRYLTQWSDDHAIILKALIQKDSNAAKMAMWQHFENTKQALFQATENDFIFSTDHYLFSENPVVHLNLSSLNHKSNSVK